MVEKSEKKKRKLKGVMKGLKRKPKPGSYDYQLQETMKPIYKTPPAMRKGRLANRPGKAPKKPNRLGAPDKFEKFKPSPTLPKTAVKRLGSKGSKFIQRRMTLGGGRLGIPLLVAVGLGKAAKKFFKKKNVGKFPAVKPKKKMGGGMMMRRPMMANEGRFTNRDVQAAKDALKIKKAKPGDRGYKMIKRAVETLKPKKKMGGGLTEATRRLRAQGLRTGGMCRGMGAALRGGDFKGVK